MMTPEDELGTYLAGLESRRTGENIGALEAEGLELLRRYGSAEDQARIYTAMAVMYANDGMREPAKVIEFSRKALAQGAEPIRACQLHLYWGEALEILNPKASNDLEATREVLSPYLEGLKLTLGHPTSAVRRPLPAVGKIDYDGSISDKGYHEEQARHQREIDLRAEVELQTAMARYHEIFVTKSAHLFRQAPQWLAELRAWAERMVGQKIVAEIVAAENVE
jgi:hypothetical protein